MLKLFSRFRKMPAREPTLRGAKLPSSTPAGGADDALKQQRGPQQQRDLRLSDQAAEWLLSLPERARPMALCERYPRIANRIALCWSDPQLTRRVLEEYLLDKRGGRQGFPAPVAADLRRLHDIDSRRRSGKTEPGCLWDDHGQAVTDR